MLAFLKGETHPDLSKVGNRVSISCKLTIFMLFSAEDMDRDFESELELEKRRQALQRELRTLQEAEAEAEESHRDTIFIQRQVREEVSHKTV